MPAKFAVPGPVARVRSRPLSAAGATVYIKSMLNSLRRLLEGPTGDRLPEPDARIALGALMVRIARSDGEYAQVEISTIDKALAARYGLSPFEAAALRGQAETLEAQAPDTVRFTRAIKDGVAYEDRLGVIEVLWQVVLADGSRDHEESGLLRLVADLLGVNDRDSNLARLRVEKSK